MYNEEGDHMERITKKNETGIEVNNIEEALERLSLFEDFYFDLIHQQEEISRQMKEMQENAQTGSTAIVRSVPKKLRIM